MTITLNKAALAANYRLLQKRFTSECGAVVKANAYGLGVTEVAPVLAAAGCQTFFVAHAREGAELRRLLPDVTIIVLHGVQPHTTALLAEYNLLPALKSPADLHLWQRPGWLHVDTGINRLGFAADELPDYPQAVGLMSHLACADEPMHHMNTEQLKRFRTLRQRYPSLPASLCNSSGIFLGTAYHFELARPGMALYGLNPTPDAPNPMQAVVRVTAPILQLRDLAEGETVGYGASWMATRPSRVAVIEAGYADGLLRSLGPRGQAVVAGGIRVPFAGRVSMDMIVLDVTDAPPLAVGDEVELIGPHLPADDVAAAAGTIGYEVLTSLKPRLGQSSCLPHDR
jgi:alanine racemase